MLASIVVPSRGGRATLPRLLDSLERQTEQDFEVVVVLDGDIDASQRYLDSQPRPFELRTIVFESNRGRSSALNAGFAAARGDVFVRCDDDMELDPDFVKTMAAVRPSSGLVGVSRDVFPPNSRYGQVYGIDADARRRASLKSLGAEAWRAWAALVAVPREVYAEVGEYDTRYVGYGWEDIDWGYRAAKAGVEISISERVLADHLKPALSTRERVAKALASGQARRHFESLHADSFTPEASRPLPRTAWNLAVGVLARVLTQRTAKPLTWVVDRAIKVLPTALARKLVALHVEAAGRAKN